jgi:hypothetical protein
MLALMSIGATTQAASISDLLKLISDYDAAKTLTAVTDMAKAENIGMETFRASGLKGSLYCSGSGVTLTNVGSTLSRKMKVEGFYGGNFDLTLAYSGIFQPESYTLSARSVKPDGTPGDYVGATAQLTPCIVLLNLIYVPVEQLPLFGYASSNEGTGLKNLCFNAVEVTDAAAYLLEYIPKETLVELLKQAVNSQVSNSTIQAIIGSVLDRIIADGSDDAYLTLLEGAKLNAMKLTITKADGTSESETFDGYELRSIAATTTVTDRIATSVSRNSVYNLGYATTSDADAARTYRIAYSADAEGNFKIYNFNNGGFAIRSAVVNDTVVNDSTGVATVTKRFANTLSPVTGRFDAASSAFVLDEKQQLGCSPVISTDLLGGNLSTLNVSQLTGASAKGTKLTPSWTSPAVSATLTPGSPAHSGDNHWAASQGGSLQTVSNSLTVGLGAYLKGNATYSALTKTTVSLRTFAAPVTYDTRFSIPSGEEGIDVTHDLTLVLDAYRMTEQAANYGSDGVWIKGHITPGDNAELVAGYDLLLLPQTVTDVTKPYGGTLSNGSSLYQLNDSVGLQYRYSKSYVYYSSWSNPLVLDATYDVASSTDGLTFEKFVPYSKLTKYTASGTLSVKWTASAPTSADPLTLFVRTRYTAESGLAPTFHALTSLTKRGETTPLAAVTDDVAVRIFTAGGAIRIEGNGAGAPVAVFSASGALLYRSNAPSLTLPMPTGAYVVRVGEATKLVVID